jgi:hypothetical protein
MGTRQGLARSGASLLGLAVAVGCTALALGPSPAPPPIGEAAAASKGSKPFAFGFTDEARPWAQYVPLARRAGSSVGRVGVFHGIVGPYGWTQFDLAYHALRLNGIRPLMVLTGGATQTMGVGEWRALNRQLARRYPQAAFQILNETNHGGFGGRMTPRRYARRLTQAAGAIRSVRPGATVIASAAAPRATYRRPHLQAARYTRRVFQHMRHKPRVHAAANIFPRGESPAPEAARALRMVRRAARGRPVWVTETALRAARYGQGVRRARLSARVLGALRRAGARGVTFFRLADDPGRAEREGALNVSGEPTVLYRHLRRAHPR